MIPDRWETNKVSIRIASGYHTERVHRMQIGAPQTGPSEHVCEETYKERTTLNEYWHTHSHQPDWKSFICRALGIVHRQILLSMWGKFCAGYSTAMNPAHKP